MFDIGRICVKLVGRDAGMRCVIIGLVDSKNVLIDGETRRRKCNVKHLEPTNKTIKITKEASKAEVIKAFKALGIELKETKPKTKDKNTKPKKARKKKEKPVKEPAKKEKKLKENVSVSKELNKEPKKPEEKKNK